MRDWRKNAILWLTWALCLFLVGAIVFLALLPSHNEYHPAAVISYGGLLSVSAGLIVFALGIYVSDDAAAEQLVDEKVERRVEKKLNETLDNQRLLLRAEVEHTFNSKHVLDSTEWEQVKKGFAALTQILAELNDLRERLPQSESPPKSPEEPHIGEQPAPTPTESPPQKDQP